MTRVCLRCALLLSACVAGGGGDCEALDTGEAFVCQGDATLAIGVGEEAWNPLPEDGTVPLERGPQGLQHVHFALRAPWSLDELPLDRALVRLSVRLEGEEVTPAVQAGLGLVADGATVVVPGVRWVVPEPEVVVGRDVEVLADVAPVGAETSARGRAVVRVAWVSAPP